MRNKPDWFYFVMFCCYSFCFILLCGASASENADIFFGYAILLMVLWGAYFLILRIKYN